MRLFKFKYHCVQSTKKAIPEEWLNEIKANKNGEIETTYIVIHCSQTRPSQKIGAKEIDRWHRERGWLKIGYGELLKEMVLMSKVSEDDAITSTCQRI